MASILAPAAMSAALLAGCVSPEADRDLLLDAGLGAGASIPGSQDLKVRRYDASGAETDSFFARNVDAAANAAVEAHADAWSGRGALRDTGVQARVLHWTTTTTADSFVDRHPGGSTLSRPPFSRVDQTRTAVFANLERRVPLRAGVLATCGGYAFVGAGAGLARTAVAHGIVDWAPAVDAFAGVAVPISRGVRLRIEGLYTPTHDDDQPGRSSSWRVDTSGTRSWPSDHHLDTRFAAVLLGVEIDL
jgi:hypothetical protein